MNHRATITNWRRIPAPHRMTPSCENEARGFTARIVPNQVSVHAAVTLVRAGPRLLFVIVVAHGRGSRQRTTNAAYDRTADGPQEWDC